MGQLERERSEDTLVVKWSLKGRATSAAVLLAKVAPLAFGALAFFFSPDVFLGDLVEREPVPGLFWLSLLLLSLFVGGLVALFRFVRRDRWIFDGRERTVAAEVRTLMGQGGTGEAELREIKALVLHLRGGLFRSTLKLRFESGEEEVLFTGHFLGAELEGVGEEIVEFLREQRYQVPLERVAHGTGQ